MPATPRRPESARTTARARRCGGNPSRSGGRSFGPQNIDAPGQRRRRPLAHRVDLGRLALAVVREAEVLPRSLVGDPGAGGPEVLGAALVRDVGEHPALLAALDLPEGVAADLEVGALLVGRARVSRRAGPSPTSLGRRSGCRPRPAR